AIQHRLVAKWPQRAVNNDNRQSLRRVLAIELSGHRRSHTVAYQDSALNLSITHDSINGAREIIHTVSHLRLVALPVPGKVDRDHAIPLREIRELIAPIINVARPPVN